VGRIGGENEGSGSYSIFFKVEGQLFSNETGGITRFKKEQRKTGGGPGPSESETPSDMDWAIHNVCPIDFEEDVSAFDSDYFKSNADTPG
jgi:hypothetical protein